MLTCEILCRGRGAVAWYPVHCTSINNTNSLISGDNKGVAAQFMEEWAAHSSMNGNATVGQDFVASFGQSNVGDTSPNILGAFCQDTGEALFSIVWHAVIARLFCPVIAHLFLEAHTQQIEGCMYA